MPELVVDFNQSTATSSSANDSISTGSFELSISSSSSPYSSRACFCSTYASILLLGHLSSPIRHSLHILSEHQQQLHHSGLSEP